MFVTFGTVPFMKRDAKINVMLTPEEFRALEDAMAKSRQRSMSTFARRLIAKAAKQEGIDWPATDDKE